LLSGSFRCDTLPSPFHSFIFFSFLFFFFLIIRPPPISTLFPYTTLFRSNLILGYVAGLTFFWTAFSWLTTVTVLGWFVSQEKARSEEHTSELQSRRDLVCRLLLEKKKKRTLEPRGGKQCTKKQASPWGDA